MPIPVEQFPILTPGQMSPFHQGLQTGLENYMNLVKAKYMPASMQADIASKAAYATYSPYSYISKALDNPNIAMLLAQHPDQFNAIADKLANMPTNPYASLGMEDMSNAGNQNNLGFFDRLKGIFNPSSSQQTPTAQPTMRADDQNKNQTINQPNKIADQGNEQPPVQAFHTQITTAGGTPVGYSYSPKNLYEQNYLKAFPNSREALNVKMQDQLWNNRLKEEGKNVDATRNSLTTLDAMENLYPQLSNAEKGTFLGIPIGNLPAATSNAQLFDQLAKIQSTNNIRALQTQRITNMDFVIGDKLKANRSLNPEAFSASKDYSKALATRELQKQKFMSDAYNRGMQIQDADTLWSKFIEKYPLFNPKTEKLIDKNYQISPFDVSYDNSENNNKNISPMKNKVNGDSYSSNLPISQGAKILSNHIKLPNFASQEEYKRWLASQPRITQEAVVEYFRKKRSNQ